jgi:hypothetical protein
MKKKTINAVITKKINDWLSSIEDKALVDLLKKNIIVTGGCITSMLLNEDVNDFDIYFKTKEVTKRVAEYYSNVFNQNNKDRTNKIGRDGAAWVLDGSDIKLWKEGKITLSSFAHKYEDILYSNIAEWVYTESENEEVKTMNSKYLKVSGMINNTPEDRIKIIINSDGIAEDSDSVADNSEYDINTYLDALSDGDNISSDNLESVEDAESLKNKYKPVFLSTNAITLSNKIQLIIRFYGNPEEIHSNYDFVHATNYWDSQTGQVVLKQEALEAIMNKELLYVGSKYPIASLVRTRKFIKRGWQINAGQYVKIAWQISELDLSNIYTLEDQLVGVDSIYFLNFIECLKTKALKDKTFNITGTYVGSVIDKIFG